METSDEVARLCRTVENQEKLRTIRYMYDPDTMSKVAMKALGEIE